jgi:outer membrane protein assembly factor BamB
MRLSVFMAGCALLLGCRTAAPAPVPVVTVPAPVVAAVPAPPVVVEAPAPPPAPATPTPFEVTPMGPAYEAADGSGPVDLSTQIFPEPYAVADGVLTFRGGPTRTGGAFGTIPSKPTQLKIVWQVKTSESKPPWNGGTGWTGQPVIVRWPDVIRHSMPKLKARTGQAGFVEVIQGSLDGNVYFIDLATGQKTRPPLRTGNPIKGSVSLDPRGYPLLFVGQGIPFKSKLGLRAYDLITHKEIFLLPGRDTGAPRAWGAFDSSGLLNRKTDTFVVGGENGFFYSLKLNTHFDPITLSLQVAPKVTRYRNAALSSHYLGIENSLAIARTLVFFSDNGGSIQALDLRTLAPVWRFDAGDDTDASLTLDYEAGAPVLYTGNEVDKTGPRGRTHLRKLDGLTGKELWERTYPCIGALTPKKIDAGVFATNAVGTGDVANLVFFTLSRCPGPENGMVLGLDKATGQEMWRHPLKRFSWSSPTLVRDGEGHTWILQGDISGSLRLLDARDGREVTSVKLHGQIEATPAVFDDMIVLGTRQSRIFGVRIVGAPAAQVATPSEPHPATGP